jgi:uncharacterized membrane protein
MNDEAERARDRYERAHDPSRVIALSDGVFAIIITLLVLEMHVPDLSAGQSLAEALDEVRPSFVAFLISFIVAAIAWAGHRDLFSYVRRTDRALIWFNVLYLLPVCLLPFAASLLSRHDEEPLALQAYGAALVAIAASRLVTWLYATNRPHLLYEPIGFAARRAGAMIVMLQGVIYAAAIFVSEYSIIVPLVIYAATPAAYFLGVAFIRAGAPPASAERDFT